MLNAAGVTHRHPTNNNICSALLLRYDFYEKAVTFKPYQVDMLDPVTANFLGDNLRCWMQIQVRFESIPNPFKACYSNNLGTF